MKVLKLFFIGMLLVIAGCREGYIDEISYVDPGEDKVAPDVTFIHPKDGTAINSANDVSEVEFQFEVSDDIELGSVKFALDGEELKAYGTFTDYRKLIVNYPYELSIGDHVVTVTATDLQGKETVETMNFTKINTIRELMNEAIFYMDFNGDYVDNMSSTAATVVGSPSIDDDAGVDKGAYVGAADSYLTFPGGDLHPSAFSVSFYLNINATPDRAGILVMGPEDPTKDGYPEVQNNRKSGFRFFRENGGGLQQFKLNVGNGTADTYFDGGAAARVDPATTDWVHFAFTISGTEGVVYINGEIVKQGSFSGIDWTGCDVLSIMSGVPRFTEWNHKSDQSKMDELLIYDRVLTQEEVKLLGML